MKAATLELQPFLLDELLLLPPAQKDRRNRDIVDNDDMYYGYLALKLLLIHSFPDDFIDEFNQEVYSHEFDLAHRRAMYILTTSHTSLAPEPFYKAIGYDAYGSMDNEIHRKTCREYKPKKYGVKY